MCGIVLRDHHHAAGVLIETMHDPRTELASDSAQIFHVKEKRIDQRPIRVAGCRMNNESRRLVDDHQIVILKKNCERQVLLDDLGW